MLNRLKLVPFPSVPFYSALGVQVEPIKKAGKESRKGRVSIETYGLNRIELLEARGGLKLSIQRKFDDLVDGLDDLKGNPDDLQKQHAIADHLRELLEYQEQRSPYSGLAHYLLNKLIPDFIDPLITQAFGHRLDGIAGNSPSEQVLTLYPQPRNSRDLFDLLGS